MPVTLGMVGLGLAGSVGKMVGRRKANQELETMLGQIPAYKNRAGFAQTLLNARMPGAAAAERNVFQSGANTMGRMQQSATSASDLMQAAAGVQSQQNQAISGINQAELADYQRRYGNLVEAQDADYAAAQRDYATKAQLRGAMQENRQNTWGDISNMGFSLASFNAAGGFGKEGLQNMFKRKSSQALGLNQGSGGIGLGDKGTMPTIGGQQLPSNFLSKGYGIQQPYSNIPSNVLSAGGWAMPVYQQQAGAAPQQGYNYPANFLSQGYGYQSPYPWYSNQQ
jgi:hypothetical protein